MPARSVNKSHQHMRITGQPIVQCSGMQASAGLSGLHGTAGTLNRTVGTQRDCRGSTGLPELSAGLSGLSTGLPGLSVGLPKLSVGLPGLSAGLPGLNGTAGTLYTTVVYMSIYHWSYVTGVCKVERVLCPVRLAVARLSSHSHSPSSPTVTLSSMSAVVSVVMRCRKYWEISRRSALLSCVV